MIGARLPIVVGATALCAVVGTGPAVAQTATPRHLVLATYADAVSQGDIGARILTEAYRRLGISVEVRRFAGDVGIDRSARGAVDGEVLRVDGIDDRYPDLVQVPVPIGVTEIAVYSRDATLRVRDWRDLAALRVAAVRGVTAEERSLGDLRVRLVDTYAELYPLLLRGEVDAIVAPVLQTDIALGAGARGVHRNALLGTFLLYHYLYRRNAALVPRVEPVLKAMLLDGTVARIQAARIAEMRGGRATRTP